MSLLEDARKQINAIDREMAILFERRMRAVEDVIQYKQEHQLSILDATREKSVIQQALLSIQNEKYIPFYEEFIQAVMAISRSYQKQILCQGVVGYQGIEGAFSYLAGSHVFPDMQKKSYATFEEVIQAVDTKDISYGIIPFENSYTGEVGEVLDCMMMYPDVYITAIYDQKISQNLLGIKGATLQDIQQVYSKDQAIYQSKKFLAGRGYELIPYPNTALAAQYVASQQDIHKAAIAAKENADLYDLAILAEDINTSSQNTTRFIIIQKEMAKQSDVFSILFTTPHVAGALVEVMRIIAKGGFNMQSIKSRSMCDKPWEYYFYVEIDGNIGGEKEQALLCDLQAICDYVRVLGAYTKKGSDRYELCKEN